ncbi:Ribosomal RNA small subunit methyltransferase D [Planctomycetes bacterium CA13]|uniref:Ribosomal RNA small subunit methyltransferase D n=1 Tax=Novipirellula herctigrandis TaxID=2527986 RepID=A0A5C5Z7F9_9BACT|nr:Ribosomal RNA small subunit methyltransferase D [Planctomycetes bacterium CA13]
MSRNESSKRKPRQAAKQSKPKSREKAKPTKLRVIGGDMRGRPIVYHGEEFTRPMKDNIRENLFNILGRAVRGAICFDMFAGTGALAIESISRGASNAIAIEQSNRAARYIRQTTESLDIESKVKILVGDAFRWAEIVLAPPEDPDDPMIGVPWIVYLCPPYILWEEELDKLNQIIERVLRFAPPGSVLVAEAEKKFDIEQLPKGNWDVRVYGGTQLAFIEPAMTCGLRE